MFLGINVCVGAFLYRFFNFCGCVHMQSRRVEKERGRTRGEEEEEGEERQGEVAEEDF